MARKRPAPYVPLSVYYADDEAIMEAGEDAELMYVRMLAYAGRTPTTEGYVPKRVCLTRLGIALRPEVGPETSPESRLERLSDTGLIAVEGDGYRLVSWLKWNRSVEEMNREREQDRTRKVPLTRRALEQGPESSPETSPEEAPESSQVPSGSTEAEEKRRKTPSSSIASALDDKPRDDVERLCQQLADRVEQNGSKRPNVTKAWRTQCRLLLDRDGKTEEQVRKAIDWSQQDPFWMANILSMPKLREKYDQLRLKATEQTKRPALQAVPSSRAPFTPEPPPREIEDDPEACDRWYREQARKHATASA